MALMRYRPRGSSPEDPRLGRFIPDDMRHVERFPASLVMPRTIAVVNRTLELPSWHWDHDQWRQGSCVGHGTEMERAIANLAQNRSLSSRPYTRRYDPIMCWNWAKDHDEWAETNSGDDNGTSVRAGYDYERLVGPRRIKTTKSIVREGSKLVVVDKTYQNDLAEGVSVVRWARTVDEMRTAIAEGKAVTIGINWYSNFDSPVYSKGYWWIGIGELGSIEGGHCTTLYGASDMRQAFRMKNSWGREYPLVWLPYKTMERLLSEWGEAALVMDR